MERMICSSADWVRSSRSLDGPTRLRICARTRATSSDHGGWLTRWRANAGHTSELSSATPTVTSPWDTRRSKGGGMVRSKGHRMGTASPMPKVIVGESPSTVRSASDVERNGLTSRVGACAMTVASQ